MSQERKSVPLIIAGPCAAESHEQMIASAEAALAHDVEVVRLSLHKPRTRPEWDGMGETGIPTLLEVAQMGVTPATEVMMPQDAEAVMEGTIAKDANVQLLLWLGARNYNHRVQQDIGALIAGQSQVKLMIKNPMQKDEAAWKGAVEHVLAGGASPEQILLCHRGFAPGENGLRNPPDLDMALRVGHEMNLPVIGDPSHSAGKSPENVMAMALKMANHRLRVNGNGNEIRFDGLIIEVHPNPEAALTDKDQQLSWSQFRQLQAAMQQLA